MKKWAQFANEYVVSLFPVFMLPIGLYRKTKSLFNKPAVIGLKIENNQITWYFKPDNWGQAHRALVAKIKKNPQALWNIYRQMENLGKRQIALTKTFSKAAQKASSLHLWKMYKTFVKSNTELYEYGLILPLLDYQENTFLSDELAKILKKRKAEKYFSLLTQPIRETASKKQDLDLLKILQTIRNKPDLVTKFIKLDAINIVSYLRTTRPQIFKLLRNHTRKYCWVYYVYEGPAAEMEYFIEILKDQIKRKVNPEKELQTFSKEKAQIIKKQKSIIRSLNLTFYEKQSVLLSRDGVFYKAIRRELQSCSYYYMEPVLREIGKRLNLSLKQIRTMLPGEIERGLLKSEINLQNINRRNKLLFYHFDGKMHLFSGDPANLFTKKFTVQEKLNLNVKEIIGTTAYPGKVKGVVKIINAPVDMAKMRQGDILVALTTNPNLMPAIRMASAMVTEEGGLTCHAAIVAREMKIPCVVGTKIAARALKDGDKVEVDATTGIIKKI